MILGNDYVDLAPLFSAHSTRNYLLSTLDFTDSVGVTSHKVAVSQLVESNESLFNKETSRFSSEHNVTKREQGKEWLIEIPCDHILYLQGDFSNLKGNKQIRR